MNYDTRKPEIAFTLSQGTLDTLPDEVLSELVPDALTPGTLASLTRWHVDHAPLLQARRADLRRTVAWRPCPGCGPRLASGGEDCRGHAMCLYPELDPSRDHPTAPQLAGDGAAECRSVALAEGLQW